MKKRLVLFMLVLLMAVSFSACGNTEKGMSSSRDDKENALSTAEDLKEGLPAVTDVYITNSAVYKCYDNKDIECAGSSVFPERWEVDFYIENRMKQLGIPIIIDYSVYESGYTPEFYYEVVDKATVDMDEYNSKYGEMISAIEDNIHLEYEQASKTIQSTIVGDFDNLVIIYSTDDRNMAAFALGSMSYEYLDAQNNKQFSRDTILSYDIFENSEITDAAVGQHFILGLKPNGKILSYYAGVFEEIYKIGRITDTEKYPLYDFADWVDIIDIEVSENICFGLKSDGTVVIKGDYNNLYTDVLQWNDIVSIQKADRMIIGLKSDGTLVNTAGSILKSPIGENNISRFDFSEWTDVKEIGAGNNSVYGLRYDGSVYYAVCANVSSEYFGNNYFFTNYLLNWENIKSVDISDNSLIALTDDGKIEYTSMNNALFNTDELSTGVLDVAVVDNTYYGIKKDDGIYIAGIDNNLGLRQVTDVDWDTLISGGYQETELSEDEISADTAQPEYTVMLSDDGVLTFYNSGIGYIDENLLTSIDANVIITQNADNNDETGTIVTPIEIDLGESLEYEHNNKIIDYVIFRDYRNANLLGAISENGDFIVLDTTIYEDSNAVGVYKENAIDMDNINKIVSNGHSVGFLYNDGSFTTMDEVGLMSDGNINIYSSHAAVELRNFNTFFDTKYKHINGDENDSELTDGMQEITWEEFIEGLGFGLTAFDYPIYEYGHLDDTKYYTYTFIYENIDEEHVIEYIETVKNTFFIIWKIKRLIIQLFSDL